MALAQQRTRRTESLERWQKALQRANDNGLKVYTVNDTGEWLVTSGSDATTLYRTDARHCTCAAGVAEDPICQHRAIVRNMLGWLPAPAPVAGDCPTCNGCGVRYFRGGDTEKCDACRGTGQIPALEPVRYRRSGDSTRYQPAA